MTNSNHHLVFLSLCADAADRSNGEFSIIEKLGLEGAFVAVVGANETIPRIVACAVDPRTSAFDDVARDKTRIVASRSGAPLFMVSNFRTSVVYRTDAVTQRQPLEAQMALLANGVRVIAVDSVLVSATRVAATEGYRKLFSSIFKEELPGGSVVDAFVNRTIQIFDDLLDCTLVTTSQVDAIERLGAGIVGYALVQAKEPELLPSMVVPRSAMQPNLVLDIIGAYFRQARRVGKLMFPEHIGMVEIKTGYESLFATSAWDLVNLVDEFDVSRLSRVELQNIVDNLLVWFARFRQTPVPTLDAIDLALMSAGVGDSALRSARLLEIGPSMGVVGVRARCLDSTIDARVHVSSDTDERQLLLRSLGNIDGGDELRVIQKTDAEIPWDLVSICFEQPNERRRLELLLNNLSLSENAVVLLFVPLAVLRNQSFGEVRRTLATMYSIRWVFTSEVEPLTKPDNATVCFVASKNASADNVSRFVFIRTALSALVTPSTSLRSFSIERIEQWRVFLRYLSTSERGKMNAEVVVRFVHHNALKRRSKEDVGWDDLVVPPDVVASILKKINNKLRPLKTLATVSNGLRTGANDVFAPTISEISEENLEEDYWQIEDRDGATRDIEYVTSADEVRSINGLPDTDRRLLLLPKNRKSFAGTAVESRIRKAEQNGYHVRPSLKKRDPWWHLSNVSAPDFFVPKRSHDRWLVVNNSARVIPSDGFVTITLHDQKFRSQIVLWMNSTLGLFASELVQRLEHVADVTVRDIKEFPIPTDDVLSAIDVKAFKQLLHRPIDTITKEYGSHDADVVRPSMVAQDRRKLDDAIMLNLFGLNVEEQRWVYRFALAWLEQPTNIRHLANAIVSDLDLHFKLQPVAEWYTPRIEQLPKKSVKTISLPANTISANTSPSMFQTSVQLELSDGNSHELAAVSADEAELVGLLINLGVRTIVVPSDAIIVTELLNEVKAFSDEFNKALKKLLKVVPRDIRKNVEELVLASIGGSR